MKKRPRGRCQQCRYVHRLRTDGCLHEHSYFIGDERIRCAGSGSYPMPEAERIADPEPECDRESESDGDRLRRLADEVEEVATARQDAGELAAAFRLLAAVKHIRAVAEEFEQAPA